MGCIGDCYYDEKAENNEQERHCKKEKNYCLMAKHPKPKEIFLECGCAPEDAIFEIRYGHVKYRQEFDLDKLIIDTTCLCRPIVKIEFSSLIQFKGKAWYGYGRGQSALGEEISDEELRKNEELLENEAETEQVRNGDKEIEIELLFELVKICNGVESTVKKWKYKKEYEVESGHKFELDISEPFTVTCCDRGCADCCQYKMIVKGKDFDGRFYEVRVVKPNLTALAQGMCD